MSKFHQMRAALERAKVKHAEDIPEASPRLGNDPASAGPDESVHEDRPAVGDREQAQQGDVSGVPRSVSGDLRDARRTEATVLGVIIGECAADTHWTDLGNVVRINLCPTFWDEEIAKLRVDILKQTLARDARILTWARAARAWGVGGRSKFGVGKIYVEDKPLQIAWIPHPKKLTEYADQLEATTYIEWVCGERKTP